MICLWMWLGVGGWQDWVEGVERQRKAWHLCEASVGVCSWKDLFVFVL